MKIEPKKLSGFLKKISLGTQIHETILDFSDKGLYVLAKTSDNVCMISGNLHSTAFEQYESIGKIGIQDLAIFTRIIDMFKKSLSIEKTESIIRFKENSKSIEIPLMDIEFIECPPKMPSIDLTENIKIPASILNSFIKDASINTDLVINLETIEKALLLSNDGKYKFTTKISCETAVGGRKASFGDQFIKSISTLSSDLLIGLGTNLPIKILEKTDESNIHILIAPRTKNDEEMVEKPTQEKPKEEITEEKLVEEPVVEELSIATDNKVVGEDA